MISFSDMATMMSYGFRKAIGNGMLMRSFWAFVAILIMVFSTLHFPPENLPSNQIKMEQFGGGGSLEEQCSSITFEDIFLYNQAIFDVRVNDDWKSAEVDAKAWINWSLADDIREDLDAFLEGIVPSGGDGWLSTDEIDAMVSIAADCLEYSITRIGIRDGSPHRGGVGVSWMNTTWEDDQTNIGHFNGVPTRHSQIRDCEGFSQDGCVEVPVIPSSERDCDIGINESLGADECRIELWLNATMVIDGVSDPNDFTVAFNSSNMSNARLDFTFPAIPDLRMDIWEECEGRFVGADEDNPLTDSAPIRGSCKGDGTAIYELTTNDDGSLTYTLNSNFSREMWPLGEDVFADFTTSPIPTDEPPTWTQQAPSDGTWIPIFEEGATKFSSWEEIASWFDDESGVSNLEVVCNSGGSEVSQSIDGSLWINVNGVSEITCEAIDASGESTGNRTWNVGVPITISTSALTLQDQHPLRISHSEAWTEHTIVRLAMTQDGKTSEIKEFHKGNSTHQDVVVYSQGVVPGPVKIWIEVLVGEFSFQQILDLGIVKESEPPALTIGSGIFDGTMWRVAGQYSDPDGEPVTFTIAIDGQEIGQIVVTGNAWESEWIDLRAFATSGLVEVEVTGCDQSGKCTTTATTIDSSLIVEEIPDLPDDSGESADSIPASGISSLVIAVSVAVLFRRRRW
jgi:hypothetical protein